MIAKAKSISHGINDILYITGESRNKKHPERIHPVKDNLLPPGLNASGIWDSMRLTLASCKRVRNSVIPPKTNLRGSKGTVWLHLESRSGVPHLHGAYCRMDENGCINNDHDIHIRAQRAVGRVALKRGWTTAVEVRQMNIGEVNRDCMEALQSMENWSWKEYAAILRSKGYEIWELQDSKDVLRGYVLKKGNARYKASELGRGRNLTVSRIEGTWEKLHTASRTKDVSMQPDTRRPAADAIWPAPVSVQGKPEADGPPFHERPDYRLHCCILVHGGNGRFSFGIFHLHLYGQRTVHSQHPAVENAWLYGRISPALHWADRFCLP